MKTWIKRSLCAVVGIAVMVTGLSACQHRDWDHPLNAQEYAERRAKVIEEIAGKLDLTEEQKRRLNVLGEKLHEQRTALMGQGQTVADSRAEIKALIASDRFDVLRAQALANEKIAALQTKGPEVLAALADFYNNLSLDQQQQVRSHLEHWAPPNISGLPAAHAALVRPNWRELRQAAEQGAITATKVESIDVQGVTRTYRIHAPIAVASTRKLPLVFNFHGLGSSATEQEKVSKFSDLADQYKFVVVYPDGLPNRNGSQHWNTRQSEDRQSEIAFVKAMLARFQAQYQIDPRRVYATGISNGGGMSNMLAGELSDTIAAIAPVAGAYYDFEMYRPSRPVPILAFHGTSDRIVPYEGRGSLPAIRRWITFWAEKNRCSTNPTLIYDKGEVRAERWSGPTEVVLYTIEGKGHTWPGSDMPRMMTTKQIDASALIWEFFAKHTLP